MAETNFTVKIAVQEDGSISLIDQAGAKIASLGQAADSAKGGLGSLESSTKGAGSAAQTAGGQMGDAGNKAGELGSKAASASGGLSSMDVALLRIKNALDIAKTALEVGAAAYNAFFGGIVDRAGSLDDLSQKIGVAGTTLSQFDLAAQATGTSLEGIGNGFKFLSKNLTEAAVGGSDSANALRSAFETMGVDVSAALTDTNSAMMALADQFKAMPDGAEKTALAMELFGKAGTEIIPFLNQGSAGIAEMTRLNDALGLSLSGETITALDNVGDKLTILGNVGTGVFTQLVAGAAPVLSNVVNVLVDMAAKAGISSGSLQEMGRTIATTVVNAIATALGAIGQFLVDISNAGIGTAIYNAFAAGLSAVGTLAASAMASVKASIYDALSVLPLVGSSYAEAASNLRASAASMVSSLASIGEGSIAIGNAGQALLSTADSLRGVGSSAEEASTGMMSAADSSDQMSSGVAQVSAGSSQAATALGILKGAGDGAAAGTKAAAGGAQEAGAAAGGAAAGVDQLSQAMAKLDQQSSQIATKQGIYDAYIEGAINYEQALIALDTAQIGGEEATQNLAVAMQAETVAREQAMMAITQQTAEQMNKNAITQVEIAALEAATAAGKTYEQAQLASAAAALEYQANEKVAAGATAEAAAKWAEGKILAEQYAKAKVDAGKAGQNADTIRSLELELNLTKQVAAGIITKTDAERQMAVAAAGTNTTLQEQAGQIYDLTQGVQDAKDSFVDIGPILTGAFNQAFDAVISGTRDLGDALEGIALGIGKQIFSNMLEAKFKDFDPTMKKNFLDLGEFGKKIFGDTFSGAADQAQGQGQGQPIGQNADGSYIYSGAPSSGESKNLFTEFLVGIGMGAFGKGVTDSFRGGPSSTGSKGWDTALGGWNMVSSGVAQLAGGPLAAMLAGVVNSFMPDIVKAIRDALDTTTKGTKERVKGESELDRSPTFSKLQDKSKLGDFTRDSDKMRGLEDNYRTGVATAVERGMKEGEANALKGAGEGIFSVIFKGDGDKMVNGAMDMGRGMAEFLSRGLAEGMTYDEMMGSMRAFAKENDITFKDALIGVNNFGKAAIEQFSKVGHADWGAQEFADGIYGITEVFKGDFPAGVNLASIALQTMEKDGTKAFSNLDAGTKQWILSVANDADAFRTVFSDLALQGFTIDTAEFEATLADITASAEFVGANIGQLLSGASIGEGMRGLGESLKAEIQNALGNSMIGDLFDTTGIATAFQELFANINDLKSGEMSSGDFMSGMASAIASGKANLEEYLPRIKAMRDAMAEVEAAVNDAFKPTAAEALAATIAAMNAGVQQAFGGAVSAAFSAVDSGKSAEEAAAAFSESFKSSISKAVAQGLQEALVQSAVMEGALGTMLADFKVATAAAMADGVITGAEQAQLASLAAQIKTTGEAAANALAPVVASVATIATGVASGTDSVSFAVNTNAEASAAAADTAIATSTTAATATVTGATTSAAATVSGAVTEAGTAYQELVTAASGATTEITGGAEAAATTVAGALTEAGEKLSSGATVAAEQAKELAASGAAELSAALGELSASAGEVTGAGATVNEAFQQASAALSGAAAEAAGTSSDTLTTAYTEAAAKAAAALDAGGTTISSDFAAATSSLSTALNSILGTGDKISDMAPDAAYGIGQSLAAVRDKVAPEMQTQIDALIGSLGDASLSPEETERVHQMMASIGGLGTAMTPEQAAQANAVIGAVGSLGDGVDIAAVQQAQAALSSIAVIGADVDPAGMEQFSTMTAALADSAAAIGDPNAVVTTMKALGEAALSSGDAANLAGTMKALGAAALDSGTASDVSATLQAFSAASAEGANNTTAIIDAFSAIDAGTSGQIQSSLQALVSSGVVAGAGALKDSLGGDAPDSIVAGLATLQAELDAGALSAMTDPLYDALGSMVDPADSVRSALDSLQDPTRQVTGRMNDLGDAVGRAISALNSAASSARGGGTPAAATGGSFAGGSAVVGEAGSPELVTAHAGRGFTVTPLTRTEANRLMAGGTPGYAMGGIVGGGNMGGGGNTLPPPPKPVGGGYTPGAEGAEFADFTGAIVEAFRAGFEGSKGFLEDFSDSIKESVRTRLIDAIMQGFAEGPQIQQYAKNIDELITKAQSLAGNGKLTADELANIQTQIKANTDAIGAQADQIDELLEPMRQAEAISTAISGGLDFSGALKNLALNPDDLEGFNKSIDQTVNDAVLNGAIQGLLASGPIQDAVKKFGDTMNDAMAGALEDGVISAEESSALHDLAVSGSEEMKAAMSALGPVLSALGIDLGDSLSEGVNRAKEVMKTASSAMDPFAALGEGETQFGNFTQSIRDQVYGNIKDGLIQAFIDSAVTQGLLAGPMMAIQGIFDQIGQKQLTTAEANAKIGEQVAIINGSLNDPAFKSAFDSTMASINSIGQSLGQTSARVESSASTAASSAQAVADASKDVCSGKCELEKNTMELGFASVNTFGRAASVSVERMLPKLALGGLVTKKTTAIIGEAGPELVLPVKDLGTKDAIESLAALATGAPDPAAAIKSALAAFNAGGQSGGGDLSGIADVLAGFEAAGTDNAEQLKAAAEAMAKSGGSVPADMAAAMKDLSASLGASLGSAGGSLSGDIASTVKGLGEALGSVGDSLDPALVEAFAGKVSATTDSIDAQAEAMAKLKAASGDTTGAIDAQTMAAAMAATAAPDLAATVASVGASLGAMSNSIDPALMASFSGLMAQTTDSIDGQAEAMAKLKAASGGATGAIDAQAISAALAATGMATVPTDAELKAQAQRLAELQASAAVAGGATPAVANLDMDRMVAGTANTVDAIKSLEDRLDKLSDAILAQPTEVSVQMDRETLMRAMAKADRLKRKARYGATA